MTLRYYIRWGMGVTGGGKREEDGLPPSREQEGRRAEGVVVERMGEGIEGGRLASRPYQIWDVKGMDSHLRGNKGREGIAAAGEDGVWVPALGDCYITYQSAPPPPQSPPSQSSPIEGEEVKRGPHPAPPPWVPAFAGMTKLGWE